MPKQFVSAGVRVKAWTFKTKAKTKDIEIWPPGALRPRFGLEDYITVINAYSDNEKNQPT